MNPILLPIVHPAFQKLKNSAKMLHFVAAFLIISHAITDYYQASFSPVYFWCQVIFAADIMILVLAGRQILQDMPKVNLFFRFAEFLFFGCIAFLMMFHNNWLNGLVHMGISGFYLYLFICEKKAISEEFIGIQHTGISIPALPAAKFFNWSNITTLNVHYDFIEITISSNTLHRFELRQNLDFNKISQIHEFCRHYLGSDMQTCS